MIHIDKHTISEMNLSWADVEHMAKQPDKFTFSAHIKRKLAKQ